VSSAPAGIDSRSYSYGVTKLDKDNPSRNVNGWLVTRVQVWAAETNVELRMAGANIAIVAGGCIMLEPNGGYRGSVAVAFNVANGFVGIVEYWYPTQADGIQVTP
jgi:hypothetical protein